MKKTNRKWIIIPGLIWLVLIGVLIGYGLTSNSPQPPKYGTEDELVSVTGRAAGAADAGQSATESGEASEADSDAEQITDTPGMTGKNTQDATDGLPNSPAPHGKTTGKDNPDVSEEQQDTPGQTGAPGGSASARPSPAPSAGSGSGSGDSHGQATPKPATTPATRAPRPTATPKAATYRFTIECKRILSHRDLWRDGLEDVIPAGGVFFSGKLTYHKGETVYDALKTVCEKNDILLDSRFTPLYDTYYVSGIGNLYEFDCGSESGWKYSVNGTLPGVGCSRYAIHEGDTIEFFYDYEI